MKEKPRLEMTAATTFAGVFSRTQKRGTLVFKALLDPPCPDTLCLLNGMDLHTEIAHIYGTDDDARYVLGRKGRGEPTEEERFDSSCVSLVNRYFAPLNGILRDKSTKTYSCTPTWLVIRNTLPIWALPQFEHYRQEIRMPKKHPFQEIWFLCRGPSQGWGLMRIDEEAQPTSLGDIATRAAPAK